MINIVTEFDNSNKTQKIEILTDTSFRISIDNISEDFILDNNMEEGVFYVIKDCLLLPYSPINRIIRTGEDFDVFVSFRIPYPEINFNKEKQLIEPFYVYQEKTLEEYQKDFLNLLNISFENELQTGHFMSMALDIEVDCRRSNSKNDKQNVEGLISNMNRNLKTTTNYVGYSEIKTDVTKTQLEGLVAEMEDHVLGLYEKKWVLQAQIENASTIDEVKNINW